MQTEIRLQNSLGTIELKGQSWVTLPFLFLDGKCYIFCLQKKIIQT
jgi:hypothetical protein